MVKTLPDSGTQTVWTVGSQSSPALALKLTGTPSLETVTMVMSDGQTTFGATVTTTATVWVHALRFPARSTASQMRLATKLGPQSPLVRVLTTLIDTFVVQLSVAPGESKSQNVPQGTVRSAGQVS